jgi:hypothetical protein
MITRHRAIFSICHPGQSTRARARDDVIRDGRAAALMDCMGRGLAGMTESGVAQGVRA